MLSETEFPEYCARHQLSASAIAYINQTRGGPPSRRVGDETRGNVCARIPSQLLGETIQAESRTCEAIYVFEVELLDRSFELWDQPLPLQLRRDKGSRGVHISAYTPDFLLLPKQSVPTLIQCKTRADLDKLISAKPDEWTCVEGQPQFLPAKEAAEKIGLAHAVFVAEDWAPVYLSNLEFIHALRLLGHMDECNVLLERVKRKLGEKSLTIYELCNLFGDLEPATIYRWIANGQLVGALKAQLLSQLDVFRTFAAKDAADAFEDEALKILDSSSDGRDENLSAIITATPKELALAIQLRDKFEQVRLGQRKPTRNDYRYLGAFNALSKANQHTLAAFLPKFSHRGNRKPRLTEAQQAVISEEVSRCVRTGIPKTVSLLTGRVNNECDRLGIPKVSCESVRLRYINAKREEIARGKLGNRGFHAALRPVPAKHATLRSEIPGLVAHIDSTQLDIRLWAESPLSEYCECPWLYVVYDEACSRALGAWIGFGKSDRFALSLAIRDAARRQGCLSPFLFNDRGGEYFSTWYEMLLARQNIVKYMRPAGAPRFGGIDESCQKQINCQLAHNLTGNTWADQRSRAASGSKKSRATARLTFEPIVGSVHDFLFKNWNGSQHGVADATPDGLWDLGLATFGNVGRPVKPDDLAFLIATSIPVKASLDKRKGIRVGYREYWSDELEAIRKPFKLDGARLDPGMPSVLYVRAKGYWITTHSRDHKTVRGLNLEGRFLENFRLRRNAAATRSDGRTANQWLAQRIDELEVSHAANSQAAPKREGAELPPSPPPEEINLEKYEDIPFLKAPKED